MADNVVTNSGTGGPTFATDDIGGVHYPINKLAIGALDSQTLLSGGNGTTDAGTIRVTISSDTTGVLSVDDNGGSLTVDATALDIRALTNADVITAELSATDNAVLDTIATPVATISATPLQRVAIFDASDTQITSFGGGTQYAVDVALGATPTGTLAVAIRDDALSTLTPIEGDAVGLRVDANGALWVVSSGTTVVSGTITANAGTGTFTVDGSGVTQPISAVSLPLPAGAATEATLATIDTDTGNIAAGYAVEGAALGSGVLIQGDDGTDRTNVLVDIDGHLQVDVLTGGGGGVQYTEGATDATITGTALIWEDTADTLVVASAAKPLPVSVTGGGDATAANQTTIIGHVDGIEALLTTIDTDTSTLASVDYATQTTLSAINAKLVTGTIIGAVEQSGTWTVDLGATDNAVLDSIVTNTTGLNNVIGTDGGVGPTSVLSVGGTESGGNIQEFRVDADGHLQVDILSGGGGTPSVISTNNSTTTPLGVSGNFTATADDVSAYAAVSILIDSDVNSATDGMTFEFSSDNTNWDDVYTFNYTASQGARRFQFPVTAQYFRVNYTNGGTGQAHFRVQTILHGAPIRTSVHRVEDNVSPDRSSELVKSVLIAQVNGSGDFIPIQSSAGGILKVSGTVEVDTWTAGTLTVTATALDIRALTNADVVTAELSAVDNAVLDSIATNTTGLDTTVGTDGAAGPAGAISVGGTESGGNFQEVRVDTDGHLQVDVLSGGGSGPTDTDDDAVAAGQSPALNIAMAYMYDGTDWSRAASGTGVRTLQTQRVTIATDDVVTVSATDLDIRSLTNTDVVTAELSATDNAVLDSIDTNTSTVAGAIFTDDAAYTPGTSTGMAMMAMYTLSPPTVSTNNDIGILRMNQNRALYTTNQGSFPVQEDGLALTALEKLDNTILGHDNAITTEETSLIGLEARSTEQTAVGNGDAVRALATLLGKLVTVPYALPASTWSYATATAGVTDTADDVAKAAAGAGIRNYVTSCQVINGHATVGTEVVIKDGTTVLWRGWAEPTGGGVSAKFDPPLRGTANTAINVANITTGSKTYFNLQGFVAAE